MSLITRMRKQEALLWVRGSADRYGEFAFDAPVQIKCRWEDQVQEFIDAGGERQLSRSVVYVDRVISVGDRLKRILAADAWILALGVWDDAGAWSDDAVWIDGVSDPNELTDAYEVRRFDQLPNLKASEFLLTAYL